MRLMQGKLLLYCSHNLVLNAFVSTTLLPSSELCKIFNCQIAHELVLELTSSFFSFQVSAHAAASVVLQLCIR